MCSALAETDCTRRRGSLKRRSTRFLRDPRDESRKPYRPLDGDLPGPRIGRARARDGYAIPCSGGPAPLRKSTRPSSAIVRLALVRRPHFPRFTASKKRRYRKDGQPVIRSLTAPGTDYAGLAQPGCASRAFNPPSARRHRDGPQAKKCGPRIRSRRHSRRAAPNPSHRADHRNLTDMSAIVDDVPAPSDRVDVRTSTRSYPGQPFDLRARDLVLSLIQELAAGRLRLPNDRT
jgi:hypothetical protein